MEDNYQRQIRVGQAINLAMTYITTQLPKEKLDTFTKTQNELKHYTLEFKNMIDSIQGSFDNSDKAQEPKEDKSQAEIDLGL
jgi:hypothetical protein